MKKTFELFGLAVFILLSVGLAACNNDDEVDILSQYESLFSKTDYFIDMLDKIYESYDVFGGRASDTSDGNYTVTPMGRLIVVKKKSYNKTTYEEIKGALQKHYKNKYKVKDIFINNGGTITIDCRK